MNIALWIVAGALAAFFLAAGISKAFQPIENLVSHGLTWAADKPGYARTAGTFEILGALGLILPGIFRFATFLIPAAAIGLALIMALSIAFHISRGEKGFAINIAVLLLAVFVAWGRATEWAL
ncbi:DoxX family protein [Arthrobacter sp. D2-10]